MLKAIIYESSTGHTKQYAEMLSQKIGVQALKLKEARKVLKKNDEVVFLGWISATKIKGLSKARRYSLLCVGAVGIYPEEEEYKVSLKNTNNIDTEFFYLRGGLDYNKLSFFKKKLLQWVGKMIELGNKPEDRELMELFKYGKNFVSESNLEPMVNYIEAQSIKQ